MLEAKTNESIYLTPLHKVTKLPVFRFTSSWNLEFKIQETKMAITWPNTNYFSAKSDCLLLMQGGFDHLTGSLKNRVSNNYWKKKENNAEN